MMNIGTITTLGWGAGLLTVVAVFLIVAIRYQDKAGLKHRERMCDKWAEELGAPPRFSEESLKQYEDRLMRPIANGEIELNSEVMVYDRYRFAIPLRAKVTRFSTENDGVLVKLLTSNAVKYPVGAEVWLHKAQLRTGNSV